MNIYKTDPDVLTIGEVRSPYAVQRLKRAVQRGRSFVNDVEVFDLSRTKARKLAYRWRGSRRGARIRAWLEATTLPEGVSVESPFQYRFG